MKLEQMWEDKPIILIGDHHGDWDALFKKIYYSGLENSILVHVGDGGEGVYPFRQQMSTFGEHNEFFKQFNLLYLSIRGNHSDPFYFKGGLYFSNFKLLPDYTYLTLGDEKWGFVGGATSIDRTDRQNVKNKEFMYWWPDEVFVLDETKTEKCDVLVTHSGPDWLYTSTKAPIKYYLDRDDTLWEELQQERVLHNKLVNLIQPKKLYCGHFHITQKREYVYENGEKCKGRILSILEFLEYKKT